MAICNSPFCQIVRGNFNSNNVSWQDSNIVHANLARDMSKYGMPLILLADQFHLKSCV